MADDLKFGPEWLRALTDGNSVTSPPPSPGFVPKYKLADHRYGREEMLALFVPKSTVCDKLKQFPTICVEKVQHPLAFIPLSEEEQRLMSQGVNSSAVLRMMGRGGSVPRGGRGGGDRGRGRGRGRGEGYYPTREYDDTGFGRGRPQRSESWEDRGLEKRFERGGFGRTFPEENSPSPRKEFSRSMSTDNWREPKRDPDEEQDDGNWRRAGPKERSQGSRGNWRERGERGFDKDYERPRFDERPYERGYNRNRYKSGGSYEEEEELPEWSMADTEEDIGTFDSSGAFMSMKKLKRVKDVSPELKEIEEPPAKEKNSKPVAKSNSIQDGLKEASPQPTSDKVKSETKTGSGAKSAQDKPDKTVAKAKAKINHEEVNSASSSVNSSNKLVNKSQEAAAKKEKPKLDNKSAGDTKNKVQLNSVKESHNDMVKESKNQKPASSTKGANKKGEVVKDKAPSPQQTAIQESVNVKREIGVTKKQEEDADFDHFDKVAENLVATVTEEEEQVVLEEPTPASGNQGGVVPLEHEDAQKWFYRDPQGEVQGPFSAAEMAEWFSAGYFTMNLMVKRGCDEQFHSLGELIKKWGRVPFLPGSIPPPLRKSPVPTAQQQMHAQGTQQAVPQATTVPSSAPPTQPNPADAQLAAQQEQLKAFLIQQQYLQQQAVFRQMQMQQVLQTLQQNESWSKLPVQQQQQLAMQLALKQQQQQSAAMMQQSMANVTTAASVPASQVASLAAAAMAAQVTAQQPQSQQPQAQMQKTVQEAKPGQQQGSQLVNTPFFQRSLSVPADDTAGTVHRSSSQPHLEDAVASIWGALNNPQASGAWNQPASVWDIEQSGKAKSLEEIEREELAKAQKEKEKREAEAKRKKEEEQRRRQEELERQKQMEMEKQRELERQREVDRQKELERQRELEMQKEMEKQAEMERQRLAELERQRLIKLQREEAERRQREQEERRQREQEERRRQQEEQERLRQEAERLAAEEERKRREEAESQRVEEMKRRQEKAEELRRQQQQKEALLRMQQEQMANIQLPQHAQWGSSMSNQQGSAMNSGLTLQQIQQLEAEKQRLEEEKLHEKMLQEQREQLEAVRQQQDKVTLPWSQRSQQQQQAQAQHKSLLEIQQEQARQHLEDLKSTQAKSKHQAAIPLATAAVWSGANPNWAQEGAWGGSKKPVPGFWEEPVARQPEKKSGKVNNAHFPALNPTVNVNAHNNKQKQQSKTKKEEETVQRLFQVMKPKDDFTVWCEKALSGMQTSVDVPTFIGFLIEVESPYEVHDYVRSYLGENKETVEFAKQFIEKRSQYRSHLKNQTQQKEEAMWGPAPAVNPKLGGDMSTNNNYEVAGKGGKKKAKKMQRVDNSILGFTCSAATERVNVGEIENL